MDLYNSLSINIPYIEDKHKDKDYISNTFSNQGLGVVYQIDFFKKKTETVTYYSANVYIIWSELTASKNLQKKINIGKEVAYLVHDEPNYWILTKNTNYNKTNGFNNRRIDFLYNENIVLKKEMDDLKRKLNHLIKKDLFCSSEFNSSEFNSSEFNSSEFNSSEITSDVSEYDNDKYFTNLWNMELNELQTEAELIGQDYDNH